MVKVSLLRTVLKIPKAEINLTGSKITMLLLNNQWMKYSYRIIIN